MLLLVKLEEILFIQLTRILVALALLMDLDQPLLSLSMEFRDLL